MGVIRQQRTDRAPRDHAARAAALGEQLALLRRKYDELWAKHRVAVRQARRTTAERAGVLTLALFALRVSDQAVAVADADHVLFRNVRWNDLDRELTPWRATARDPVAPPAAPNLRQLVVLAAGALLARSAPAGASGRYERPERGDVFDVRFERLEPRGLLGISIRDVTRLVAAERGAARRGAGRGSRRQGRAALLPRG